MDDNVNGEATSLILAEKKVFLPLEEFIMYEGQGIHHGSFDNGWHW